MPCYYDLFSIGTSALGFPCGDVSSETPHVNCCQPGSLCLDNGICQYTHAGLPGGSGYYAGGCTDPTFTDPTCQAYCKGIKYPDVVYVYGTGQWQCCGIYPNNTRACGIPFGAPFAAPAPALLQTTASIVASNVFVTFAPLTRRTDLQTFATLQAGQTSSTASSPTLSPTTSSAVSTQPGASILACSSAPVMATASMKSSISTSSSTSTSSGVWAGLGVSVAWATLATIAVIFLMIRNRRLAGKPAFLRGSSPLGSSTGTAPSYQQDYKIDTPSRMHELDNRQLAEMRA